MTQVQLTDQQLNRALAELMGYTIKELPIGANGRQLYALVTPEGRERLSALTIDNAYLDAPVYAGDPAASLEVQAKAIEVDAEQYIKNVIRIKWGEKSTKCSSVDLSIAADIANASPRERAEAAYITLSQANTATGKA